MRPLTAGLAIKREALLAEAKRCCQDLARQALTETYAGDEFDALLDWLTQIQPHVVLVDVEHIQSDVENRVRQIKGTAPQSMVIAVHHAADPYLILTGMRAGLDEYFYPPLAKSLRDLLERKIEQHTKSQFLTDSDRRTIGFLSAKGGCGGTTVACQTAAELGKRMHESGKYHVLLADLDLTGGNVRFLMRSKTPMSIFDAIDAPQGLDISTWNRMISNGHSGLEVISAPVERPARMPEQRDLERVLNFARARYQWTVADLGCCLTPYNLSVLESLNELYLIASPDVLALFQVKQILGELQEHNFPAERIRLVLNRSVEYEDKIVAQEAQKMLGITAYFSLPNDSSGLAEAYASGRLLTEQSPLGIRISEMTTKISGIAFGHHGEQRQGPWYRKFHVTRG